MEFDKNINIDKPVPRGITINGIDLMDLPTMRKKSGRQVLKNIKKTTPGRKKRNTPLALTHSNGSFEKYLVKRKAGEDNAYNGRKPLIVEDNVKIMKNPLEDRNGKHWKIMQRR